MEIIIKSSIAIRRSIFGVTPDRSKFLIEELGISPSKVSLLPIGADVKRIPLDEEKIRKDKSTFLKEHNLSSDTFIFAMEER